MSGEGTHSMRRSERRSSTSMPSLPRSPSLGDVREAVDYITDSQRHLLQRSDINPAPNVVPPPIGPLAGNIGVRQLVCFIGLPYRGKPFVAHRLAQYLSFFHGTTCGLFDACNYMHGGSPEANSDLCYDEILNFFQNVDQEAMGNLRHSNSSPRSCSSTPTSPAGSSPEEEDSFERERGSGTDIVGRMGILYTSKCVDALDEIWSGSSKRKRRLIVEMVEEMNMHVKVMFVEVMVTDRSLVEQNLFAKYGHEGEEELERHKAQELKYKQNYTTLQSDGSEDDLSFVTLIDYGEKVLANKMNSFLRMRLVQFLSNLRASRHTIYLSRHGLSEYNMVGKLGGNPKLSKYGKEYAIRFAKFCKEHVCVGDDGKPVKARLWTSSLRRTIDTAQHVEHPVLDDGWVQMMPRVYRNLDEIFAGEYEGLTYEQIKELHGDEAMLRSKDKIGYRYPRGESYFDIIARLDPVMHELETTQEPIVIVSHQATLRMVYAHLMGADRASAPKLVVPVHTVVKITYDPWHKPTEERFSLGPTSEEVEADRSQTVINGSAPKQFDDGQMHL